jgi:predicted  nucleic acid-binding Zn-ribbon protein
MQVKCQCGRVYTLCPTCDGCPDCGTPYTAGDSSEIPSLSNNKYLNDDKSKPNRTPNRTHLRYEWQETFRGRVLTEIEKGTYKTPNEALTDVLSFPNLTKPSWPENG